LSLSGVMAVHNEQEYLPYSLKSLLNVPLDELIVVLDRCSDRSEEIIKQFNPSYPVKTYCKSWQKWKSPRAEVADFGFSKASGDIIFNLEADLIFDHAMFNPDFFVDYDMVVFRNFNHDLHTSHVRTWFEVFMTEQFRKTILGKKLWPGGIFGTKRTVWQHLRFRDSISKYGEHKYFQDYKQRLVKQKHKFAYVNTTNHLHLRDHSLTKKHQLQQGKGRVILGFPLWKVVLHSFLHCKPYVLIGYLRKTK